MPPGFTISLTAPHFVPNAAPNAAPLTRNLGTDLPPSKRASFVKKYPSGLPSAYKMLGPHDEGVPLSYLEEYLPIGYYTNAPCHALAKFSTGHGERKFRKMEHILPRRRIHLWDKDELQAVCNSTRKTYWADMKTMAKPSCWEDLYEYYDAFDLYHYGALNLWNVINQLFDENLLIYDGMERECANHIGQWADDWIGVEQNQRKLKEWTEEKESSIVFILSDEDRKSMGDIPDDMIPLVASALKARRHMLLTGVENFRKNREGASDVMEACKNRNFQNWLAGEQVFENNALPRPPPAEAHRCSPVSMNAPLPYFRQEGLHYYLPEAMRRISFRSTSQSSAVEELHKSSAAAVTATQRPPRDADVEKSHVIARGTKKLVPENVREDQAPIQAQTHQGQVASKEPVSSRARECTASSVGESQQSAVQKKREEGEENKEGEKEEEKEEEKRTPHQAEKPLVSARADLIVAPVAETRGHTSPSPTPRESRAGSKPESDESIAPSSTVPSRQYGPHHAQHVNRASLSEQMGNSAEIEIPKYGPMPVHNPLTVRHKEQRPVLAQAIAPVSLSTQAPQSTNSLTSKPPNVDGRAVSSNGNDDLPARPAFVGDQDGLDGRGPQNDSEDRNTSTEVGGQKEISHGAQSQSRASAEPSPCSNEVHQPRLLSQPQMAPPVTSNCDVTARSDAQMDKTPPSAEPSFTNTNTMLPSTGPGRTSTAPRGGYKNNNRGRRDNQSQRIYGNGYHSLSQNRQPFLASEASETGHDCERQWRRDSVPPQINHDRQHLNGPRCNNGPGVSEYKDCSCVACSDRNKSVFVRVKDNDFHTRDIQTRLKFGLSALCGDVDDVFPMSGRNFIVRFQREESAVKAMKLVNITLSDKMLSIHILPVFRSKWYDGAYNGIEHSKRQRFEQRQQKKPQDQHHQQNHQQPQQNRQNQQTHHQYQHQHQHQQQHHQHQQPQPQPQPQPQYPCMTQPHFNQGTYSSGMAYNPMPFGPREPHQMRLLGQYGTSAPPHGIFQHPQRGAIVPSHHRGGDVGYGLNYGPHYMGGQLQQPPAWQLVQDQHGFYHGAGKAAAGQSEQRTPSKAPSAELAECKGQSQPCPEEAPEKKDLMGRHDQQEPQQQQKKESPVTSQGEPSRRASNHKAKVSLPCATPQELADAESRDRERDASAYEAVSPMRKGEQSGTIRLKDARSFTTKGTDGAAADEEAAAAAATITATTTAIDATESSEISLLVDTTGIDKSSRAITCALPEKDEQNREQVQNNTALSVASNKVSTTPIRSKPSNVVDESPKTIARDPSSDSPPGKRTSTQASQPTADTTSPGSCSSKTMSLSSTPRTTSPHQNFTKRPLNGETKDSTDGKHHRQSSSHSSASPTKLGKRNARKQNGHSQQQHNQAGFKGPHVLNAAAKRFDFPGHGRGTVRLAKQTGKPSILDDGKSSQGRGTNATKQLGKQSHQLMPATHETSAQRKCAGEAEARPQQPGHAGGEVGGESLPEDRLPGKAAVASSLKVPKRRNGRTNSQVLAQEGRGEKTDGPDKPRQASPYSTGEGSTLGTAASSSATKDKPSSGQTGRPEEQSGRDGRNTSSSADRAGAEQGSHAGATLRSADDGRNATLGKSTSGSLLDETAWPSLPSSGGGVSPQKSK
ncbi:hypothetical protein E4U42_003398 [Claviceps africana]|uniref:RRM domain-containing protein n=1 Tax=Claviceps africana TaxID=83212 RepID=A0A8K0J6M8_9HYPO|nr:hypothetical protein E4U42_003398 [Claviceps africana]